MLEITLLSIAQGITEFLPISSSAHLILISKYLNFSNENLTLDVSLHLGSLVAVIFFFKKEISNFIKNRSLIIKIIIGSLPTLIIGFLLIKYNLIELFRNTSVIAATTILFGILLYLSDKSDMKKNIYENFSLRNSIFIGLLQTLSLIPGVSRSGITMTGARFLNYDRVNSAKISFLFSIPTLLSVSAYSIIKLLELKNLQLTLENFWATLLSFLFSYIILKFFLKFLRKFSLIFFVIYRVVLGIIILIFINV